MAGRGLLKCAVGVLFGACTVGAFLPVLLILPNVVSTGILLFVLGGTLILSVTAQDVRQAIGRSLVTLGSAFVMLPILSLLLGALLVTPSSDVTAKGDKSIAPSGPSSHQVIAACVAFGAGSLIAMAGLVILINGQHERIDLDDRARKKVLSINPVRNKVASGIAEDRVGQAQAAQYTDYPKVGEQSGNPAAMSGEVQDSPFKWVSRARPEVKRSVSDRQDLAADARTRMASAAMRTLKYMSEYQAASWTVGASVAAGRQGSVVGARMRTHMPQAFLANAGSHASGQQQSAGPQEPISRSTRIIEQLAISKPLSAEASVPPPAPNEATTQIRQADTKRKPASRLKDRLEAVGYSISRSDVARSPMADAPDRGITSEVAPSSPL